MRTRKQNSEKMVIRKDDGVTEFVDNNLDELNNGVDLRNQFFENLHSDLHRGKSRFKIGGVYQDYNGDFLTILNLDVDKNGNIRAKCRFNSDDIEEWVDVTVKGNYETVQFIVYNTREVFFSSCWESSI